MQKYIQMVEKHAQLAKDASQFMWENPETGYREWKAHAYLTEKFRALGYELTEAGNIPGFYTDIDTGRPGPMLLVMGELDSLICNTHPEADPNTGAVHACGHCCQSGGLLGFAAALKERKANKIFICSTFGLFTGGLDRFDQAYQEGLIDRVLTTNLIYQAPELLSREWYINCDMSKYIAYLIDTLNHDTSISDLLNPNDKIQKILTKYRNGEL